MTYAEKHGAKMCRVALESVRQELKGIHQQAELYDAYGCDTPGTSTASKRRKKLIQAETWIMDMIEAYQEPDIDPQIIIPGLE